MPQKIELPITTLPAMIASPTFRGAADGSLRSRPELLRFRFPRRRQVAFKI
jgi:hypothetical protein